MEGNQIGIIITILLYLCGMIFIGYRTLEKNKTVGDFYLGGRQLGPLVTAMSAEASDMSSWLLMGLPGVAYISGISDAGWTAIGLAAGTYLNWLIVAKRLRRYTEKIDAITLPEFFSKRYHDTTKLLMLISALWIIVFFVPYTASGFVACGKLFNSLFGVNYHVAMIVSAIIIILYTTLGGFLAASTTDFVQSIVMSIALIVILLFGVNVAGGLDAVIKNAAELPGYLSMTHMYDATAQTSTPYSLLTIVSTCAWGLGYFGMPHILLRFMAIEDENKVALSRRVASVWVVISMAASVLIGVVGYTMSKVGALEVLTGTNSETIIVRVADLMSRNGIVFAFIAGVVLSGILASTMSTSDSQLLAASSSMSNDIINGYFNKNYDQKTLLKISRICLLAIALIGMVLAWDPNGSVFQIVSFAWAGFGASFGPVVLLALFWKNSNKWGALSGMITGGAMIFIWKFLIKPIGGIFGIYELLPAFILALVVNVVVSLVSGGAQESVQREFEEV